MRLSRTILTRTHTLNHSLQEEIEDVGLYPLKLHLKSSGSLAPTSPQDLCQPYPSTLYSNVSWFGAHVKRKHKTVLTEDLLAQLLLNARKHGTDVIQELTCSTIALHDLPQFPWLLEVAICQISRTRRDATLPNFVKWELVPIAESHGSRSRADIVRVCAVVAVDSTGPITLVW